MLDLIVMNVGSLKEIISLGQTYLIKSLKGKKQLNTHSNFDKLDKTHLKI